MHLFKNLNIFLVLIFSVFCSYGIAMDIPVKPDPPFFELTTENGRKIYILGSIHTIPVTELLSINVFKALLEIAQKKAILYTEHDVTNKHFLEYFKKNNSNINSENKNNDNVEIFKKGFENMFKQIKILKNQIIEKNKYKNINHTEIDINEKNDFENIRNMEIYLDEKSREKSTILLSEVLKASPWLCALIMTTHHSILYSQEYEGFEYELEHAEYWKKNWGNVRYLETPQEIMEIFERNSSHDYKYNQLSIKSNTECITRFYILKKNRKFHKKIKNTEQYIFTNVLNDSINNEQKILEKNYSWEIIHNSNKENIPNSAIERNKLWAGVIAKEVQNSPSDPRPILIVVGKAHLAGFQDNFSFLSFLLEKLGNRPIRRLTKEGHWVEVDQNKK